MLLGAIRIAGANRRDGMLNSTRTIVLGVVLLLAVGACSGASVGLAPDLSFWVDCPRLSDRDQIKLENNLYAADFDVLNESRLARQMREEYPPLLNIEAMDRRGFLFQMTVPPMEAASGRPSSKVVSANVARYSRPPTRHDNKMEQAILTMTTADLGCSARQLARNNNATDSTEMYRHVAKLNRDWFEQAKALAPEANALQLH